MKKNFFSLRYKIIIVSLILIILPLLTVSTVSYFKSSEIILDKIGSSKLQTLNQVAQNIDYINSDIHNTSLYLIQNKILRDYLKLDKTDSKELKRKKEIKAFQELMYLISAKDYVHSIHIQGVNSLSINTGQAEEIFEVGVYDTLAALKGKGIWIYDNLKRFNKSKLESFSFLRQINDLNNINRKLGWMRINISKNKIEDLYISAANDTGEKTYLINSKGKLLSNKPEDKLFSQNNLLNPEVFKNKNGFYLKEIKGEKNLVTFTNLSINDFKLLNIIPLRELNKDIGIIKKVTIYGIIIAVIISLLLALLFYYHILHPLEEIRGVMRKVEKGNFDIQLDESGNDEMALISKSFNKMSARLQELIQKVYLFKIKEKEAELKALQAQINPHFLYNTLDTIYWTSRMEKAFSTSKLIQALAKLFRLSISQGGEKISLSKEIEHLKSYLTIQAERYEEMIDFKFKVDEDLLNAKVIKLVLQPIVENSIVHGIEAKGEPGYVKIDIYREGKYLIYRVEDNGAGTDQNEIRKLLESETETASIGLKNVNERLKLFFGEACGLEFYSKPKVGTTVLVKQYLNYELEGASNDAKDDDCR